MEEAEDTVLFKVDSFGRLMENTLSDSASCLDDSGDVTEVLSLVFSKLIDESVAARVAVIFASSCGSPTLADPGKAGVHWRHIPR